MTMDRFYIVQAHDTLSKTAKKHGTTVAELRKLNDLSNPNKLNIGQKIYLRKEDVCGFTTLFLDADRNPIEKLEYLLEFNGKSIRGCTESDGKGKSILTDSPTDDVRIQVQRFDGSLKEIATVRSGYRNKLVTLVSPLLVVDTELKPHPKQSPNEKADPKTPIKPAYGPHNPATPTTDKKDLGPKAKQTTTPKGAPVTVVEGDIPALDEFLDPFNGEVMTDADYEWAAKELGIEIAVIRAFATVESGGDKGKGFILLEKKHVPTILYERHKFSSMTKHKYSAKYPDISLPTGYYVPKLKYVVADDEYKKPHGVPIDVKYYRPINKRDSQETISHAESLQTMLARGEATKERDTYLRNPENYSRLVKAYQLDKEAALKSCSWGAFQIFGEYWNVMGYESIYSFTKAMSRSEKEQIKAFVRYMKKVNPAIISYLKKHDWAKAAEAYNGPSYKQNSYDKLLANAYEKLRGNL